MADDIVLRSSPEKSGAKHFANPKNIFPKEDTEPDTSEIARTAIKMDISNPAAAKIIPKEHPVEHFSRSKYRPHFGAGLHRSLVEEEQ